MNVSENTIFRFILGNSCTFPSPVTMRSHHVPEASAESVILKNDEKSTFRYQLNPFHICHSISCVVIPQAGSEIPPVTSTNLYI